MMTDTEVMAHATVDTRNWEPADGPRWSVQVCDHEDGARMEYLTVVAADERTATKTAEEYAMRILQMGDVEVLDDIESIPEDEW